MPTRQRDGSKKNIFCEHPVWMTHKGLKRRHRNIEPVNSTAFKKTFQLFNISIEEVILKT